jgi:DNA-binding NarL/FixJ family response regulator
VHKPPDSRTDSKIRVVVADDHAMIRQGLCSVLTQNSDILVVGEAANGEEAVMPPSIGKQAVSVITWSRVRMRK